MKTSFIGSIALVLAMAAPISAYPADTTHPASPIHRTMRHDPQFGRATALAAPRPIAQPPAFVRETDGLGRNDDDCVFGCIDH